MLSEKLNRWGGLLALIGVVVVAVTSAMQSASSAPAGAPDPLFVPSMLGSLVGFLLIAGGLPGIYSREIEQAGALGVIGYSFLQLGVMLGVAFSAVLLIIVPGVFLNPVFSSLMGPDSAPPGGFLELLMVFQVASLIGLVVFGWASARAKVFPAAAGWLTLAAGLMQIPSIFMNGPGGPLALVVAVVQGLLVIAGLGWMGLATWQGAGQKA